MLETSCGFGPQQARHVVASDRRPRIRQVGDEAEALAQGKFDAASVETQRGEAEKPNLQASHHEPLNLRSPAGDGPGTAAS